MLDYASRGRKDKSTKPEFRVSSQLSPLDLGTRWRKLGESGVSRKLTGDHGKIASGRSAIWMAPADQQPASRTGAKE